MQAARKVGVRPFAAEILERQHRDRRARVGQPGGRARRAAEVKQQERAADHHHGPDADQRAAPDRARHDGDGCRRRARRHSGRGGRHRFQLLQHLGAVLPAISGMFLEAAHHERVQRERDRLPVRGHGLGLLRELGGEHRLRGCRAKGRPAGEHLVAQDS